MKRLLAQIGITYFSVLAIAFYLQGWIVILVGGVALLLTVLFFILKRTRKTVFIPAMALTVVIACAVNIGYSALFVQPVIDRYGNTEHTVRAVITDEEYKSYSKYYYRLKATEIDGENVSIKVLLKTPHMLDAETDDVLTFTSVLKETENNYYRAKGYYLVSDDYDAYVEEEPAFSHTLYYRAIQLRRLMRHTLESVLPSDCAALCRAVLIGDKYALSQNVRDNFRYAGASYFIVVSGMHFAVICFLILKLLKRAKYINRWVRFAITMLFIVLYAAITGFQPSVLRSGIMMVLLLLGDTIRRQTYPLNHLGLAGIIMPFIVSPYGAGDIGLILSYYATFAILLWASPIAQKLYFKDRYGNILGFNLSARWNAFTERIKEKRDGGKPRKDDNKQPFTVRGFLYKLWNCVALMLSVSIAANILVFPISVFVFRGFSLVTLVSALLLYCEIYLILILSFVICIFFWFKPFIALLAVPLTWLCRLVLWIVDGLASLPFAYCHVSQSFILVWTAVTVVLGLIVILYRNHYRYLKTAALFSAIILLAGCLLHEVLQLQVLSLEVYNCGTGVCAGINSGGNLHLLSMDAKSKELYPIWSDLSERYGGADTALCSSDKDLRRYRMYRDDEFAISTIMLYDKSDDHTNEGNIVGFDGDRTFVLDDGVIMEVSVVNDTVVPYITAGDRTVLVIPDGCTIEEIPIKRRQADVIVLSEAFSGMEELRCESLILSTDVPTAFRLADAMKDCYQHVYFTGEGDVRCRLR